MQVAIIYLPSIFSPGLAYTHLCVQDANTLRVLEEEFFNVS